MKFDQKLLQKLKTKTLDKIKYFNNPNTTTNNSIRCKGQILIHLMLLNDTLEV